MQILNFWFHLQSCFLSLESLRSVREEGPFYNILMNEGISQQTETNMIGVHYYQINGMYENDTLATRTEQQYLSKCTLHNVKEVCLRKHLYSLMQQR